MEKFYSLIIISKDENSAKSALNSIKEMGKNIKNFEIIVATGNNPSKQRNEAALLAKGEFLVFLDNDSKIDSRLLHYYEDGFSYYTNTAAVGGPSVYLNNSSILKTSFNLVLSSIFGLGPSKSRYSPIGKVRITSEKELILCNLCVKKSIFLNMGGFSTHLYPNEENEFLNRLSKKFNIVYHPLAIVYRDPRDNVLQFSFQLFKYGIGRFKHYKLKPEFLELIYFIPLLFTIYVLSLPFIMYKFYENISFILFYLFPLIIYSCLSLSATIFSYAPKNNKRSLLFLPPLFFICHVSYGLGLLSGPFCLFFKKKKNISTIVNITLFCY